MDKKSLKYIKKYHGGCRGIFLVSTRLAPYITKLLLYTPITANQISFFSFVFVFIPAALIAFGNYWLIVLGALLLQVSVISDEIDGAVARIKKTTNQFGGYYCTFVHDFIPPILMIALSINSYRFFNNPLFLVIGLIIPVAMFLTIYSRIIKDYVAIEYQIKHNKKIKSSQDLALLKVGELEDLKDKQLFCKADKFKFVTNFIYFFNTFCHLNAIMLLLAIFDLIHYAIIFYAPFYILIAIVKVSLEVKKGMKDYKFE